MTSWTGAVWHSWCRMRLPGSILSGGWTENSEGLLLMTNVGDFANQMMHPRYHPKCYRVTVRPDMNDEQAMRLAEGVRTGRQAFRAPAQVTVLSARSRDAWSSRL